MNHMSPFNTKCTRFQARASSCAHMHIARQWILGHLGYRAPSTFKKKIEGPWGTGEHITDHGDVLEEFSQIEEEIPAQAIWHHGGEIKLIYYGRTS